MEDAVELGQSGLAGQKRCRLGDEVGPDDAQLVAELLDVIDSGAVGERLDRGRDFAHLADDLAADIVEERDEQGILRALNGQSAKLNSESVELGILHG